MHEFGIATNIIKSIEKEAKKREGMKVKEVDIKLGTLLGIQPETLKFLLRELSKDSEKIFLKNAKIKISKVNPEVQCSSKHRSRVNLKVENHSHNFPILLIDKLKCPKCGKKAKLLHGDKCIVERIVFQ